MTEEAKGGGRLTRRMKLIIAGAVVVVAGLAAGLAIALTSSSASTTVSHKEYAQLFAKATVMHTKITVLNDWPKPYQIYHDGYLHRCYEWWDKPLFLYNLCFDRSNGLLVNKELA
jgi:hypothetical protein